MEKEHLMEEQIQNLPNELRRAIETIPWFPILKEIEGNRGFNQEQFALIEQETMLILYGFDDPKNYIDNLVREVGLEESAAVSLAEEVAEKILTPISKKAEKYAESTAPNDLPMIEEGKVVQDVPHDTALDALPIVEGVKPLPKPLFVQASMPTNQNQPETISKAPENKAAVTPSDTKTRPTSDTPVIKPDVTADNYRYPGGKDPYREPIE